MFLSIINYNYVPNKYELRFTQNVRVWSKGRDDTHTHSVYLTKFILDVKIQTAVRNSSLCWIHPYNRQGQKTKLG